MTPTLRRRRLCSVLPMTWSFEDHDRYVYVSCHGTWHLRSVLRLIDETRRRLVSGDRDRVLLDMAAIRGPAPDLDRYITGVRLAKVIGNARVAIVAAPEILVTRFGTTVANQRGGRMMITTHVDEADRWLRGQPA